MKISKRTVDRAVTVTAAASGFVLSILIRHHVISAADATDLAGGLTAVVGAYHGGAYVQRKRTASTVPDIQV